MSAPTKSPRIRKDTRPTPAFTKLSALIPDENKLVFSTTADLQTKIKEKMTEYLESETDCYMLITGVAGHIVEALYEELERYGIRKVTRFTYEQTMESLIIRLMPGAPHEALTRSFCFEVMDKVESIPGYSRFSLSTVGATMFRFPGGRSKQGDAGFKPHDTRRRRHGGPSVMVEVGYSESLSALRCDAQWWLENTGGQTRMVIIIEISKHPNALGLECWQMIGPNQGVHRKSIPRRSDYTQYFDIDHAGAVTPAGCDLVIPYRTLFDTSQHGDPDIIVSAGELSEWARYVYDDFQ
ncbi:hypothetical protein L873DRAFT_1786157 [Choiromyces venosus 120613-1]|uniref:Uncharacterized protein n=1 Tax=Choiromyces venosus 120613-1 TaxID=1336337 RepID=A0A3N4K282_9PEZI|nr:hypothetical protein L873DRAFT_1786157 [Choiromyces venosus 120613-1]